jgi:hypothetical protein
MRSAGGTIGSIEAAAGGSPHSGPEGLMYDVMHAAIAHQRVHELVETAGAQRAARQISARKADVQPAAVAPRPARRLSLAGLRPRLR